MVLGEGEQAVVMVVVVVEAVVVMWCGESR